METKEHQTRVAMIEYMERTYNKPLSRYEQTPVDRATKFLWYKGVEKTRNSSLRTVENAQSPGGCYDFGLIGTVFDFRADV